MTRSWVVRLRLDHQLLVVQFRLRQVRHLVLDTHSRDGTQVQMVGQKSYFLIRMARLRVSRCLHSGLRTP